MVAYNYDQEYSQYTRLVQMFRSVFRILMYPLSRIFLSPSLDALSVETEVFHTYAATVPG